MAYPSEHYGMCSNGALRIVLALVATFLIWYGMSPPLSSRESSNSPASCSCDCDCYEEFALDFPLGFVNNSYADCGDDDPDMQEEMEKDSVALLSEELALQRRVANDSLNRTKALAMDARQASLHYEKEAEKCNAQTEICEAARERAEAEIVEEYKLSAEWEKRARELGWEEEDSRTGHTYNIDTK